MTEELLGLAVETGSPAASALRSVALPRSLSLLGRFELTAAGRPVRVGPGQDAQLLKLVAVSGGRIHVERIIETMWPTWASTPAGIGSGGFSTDSGRRR